MAWTAPRVQAGGPGGGSYQALERAVVPSSVAAALEAPPEVPESMPVAAPGRTRRAVAVAAALATAAMLLWMHVGSDGQDRPRPLSRSASEEKVEVVWAYTPPDARLERCGKIDDDTDYAGLKLIDTIADIRTSAMCCSACAAYPGCGAWTWGKNFSSPYVGGHCWVKERDPALPLRKEPNGDVVSGVPEPTLRKFGVVPAPKPSTGDLQGVLPKDVGPPAKVAPLCPGKLGVGGHGPVTLVNANGSTVQVLDGSAVVSHLGARSYWADWCWPGGWNNTQYAVIFPLGKTIKYTMDLSGTGCGCNAAFYLVPMKYNYKPGSCKDYYCDVMSVCGVPCIEMDLQEANQYAWRSTLHAKGDFCGKAMGYSGSRDSPSVRDWSSEEYSPGGKCIDTNKPFQVAISFPTNAAGDLVAFELVLSQEGKNCPLKANMSSYSWGWPPPRKEGWGEVTQALKAGLTPVMSYWKSNSMLWMDGLGADGRGPCVKDTPEQCPERVRFYGFSIEPYKPAAAVTTVQHV